MSRILLKVSGEALSGDKGFGYCADSLTYLCDRVKSLIDDGIQVAIVVGAGNLVRGGELYAGVDRVTGDSMGMLGIVMNGIAIKKNLENIGVNSELQSAFEIPGIVPRFNKSEAMKMINSGNVIIFVGGTGNPHFTTDTACVLRALEMECDFVVKATQVDGLYDKDPNKFEDAKFIESCNFSECLEKGYKVMDQTAFALAKENDMPIKIVSYTKNGAINRAVKGEKEGTTIRN